MNLLTITGRLTEDPVLKFIQSGAAVVEVNVAHNHRKKNGDGWEDDGATFIRATVWRDHAEHVAESLTKGDEVVIIGELRQRTWESNGEKRSTFEIRAESITPSLRFATAKVTKAGASTVAAAASGYAPVASDPWANDQSAPF